MKEVDTELELKAYYQLYLRTMRGHGSPPHSYKFFKKMWNQFSQKGWLKVLIAYKEGKVINGIICLSFNERVVWWSSVCDRRYRSLNGGTFLLWKAIQWATENSFKIFDFGRTREESGVYFYKTGFNGKKVELNDYFFFPKEIRSPPHPEKQRYNIVKGIWRKLPLSLIKCVGPSIRRNISF